MTRPRSVVVLALMAFGATLLPLAAATGYFAWRERQLGDEVATLERRLEELDRELAPIGHLDQLRGQMLARKNVVEAMQEPQRGLQASLALTTQIPANAHLLALDVDDRSLSVRLGGADAAASTQMLEHITAAGFSDATGAPAAADGTVLLSARLDPEHFKAAASKQAVTR